MNEFLKLLGGVAGVIILTMIIWSIEKMRRWRRTPQFDSSEDNIFLSYKSENVELVRFISEQMQAAGHNVWFNEYRVGLGEWETDFEQRISEGTRSAGRAVFFTNALWARSIEWCVDAEAKPLLARLPNESCLEVRLPPEPDPHRLVPGLSSVRSLDGSRMDKWSLLAEIQHVLNLSGGTLSHSTDEAKSLNGLLGEVPYSLNTGRWKVSGRTTLGDGKIIPLGLSRVENGVTLTVNVIAGASGMERQPLNDRDMRQVFRNLRRIAQAYFRGNSLAGECVGAHLFFHSDLSHGAFT